MCSYVFASHRLILTITSSRFHLIPLDQFSSHVVEGGRVVHLPTLRVRQHRWGFVLVALRCKVRYFHRHECCPVSWLDGSQDWICYHLFLSVKLVRHRYHFYANCLHISHRLRTPSLPFMLPTFCTVLYCRVGCGMDCRVEILPAPGLRTLDSRTAPVHLLYGAVTVISLVRDSCFRGALRFEFEIGEKKRVLKRDISKVK